MLSNFTRPRPIAWFFFILAFGTCVALGTWQVKRLQWKEALIAQLAEANAAAPLSTLPDDTAALEPLQFRKVRLSGRWQGDIEFHLTPRYWRNQLGYWVITPFTLRDGRTILVNRGWVPAAKKDPKTRPETRVSGPATLNALLRVGAERSYFTPPNNPEKNLWFGRDVAEMAAKAGLKRTIPAMIDVIGVQETTLLPVPSDGSIRIRNDHLSYIITWDAIAIGILVIFLVYHRKK